MWETEIKSKKDKSHIVPFFMGRGFLMGLGISFLVLSFVVLGFGLFEGFLGGGKIKMLQLPGFQEVELETAGLYAGVYQHRGTGPLPINSLTKMDVRVMSKEDYEEVPVLMNSSGQTFNRLGFQGLPLFNFAISKPGAYTISGVSTGGETGPIVKVLLIPQTAGNIKQTLFVSIAFFIVFLAMGILILLRLERWAPKKLLPTR